MGCWPASCRPACGLCVWLWAARRACCRPGSAGCWRCCLSGSRSGASAHSESSSWSRTAKASSACPLPARASKGPMQMEPRRKLQPLAPAPRGELVVSPPTLQALGDPGGPFVGMHNFTVMMVDDEPITLGVIQSFLEEAGYQSFVTTTRPAEAMSLLRERRPDILLLDLVMPKVSGFDILAQVRADEGLRFTPVIIVTADSDPAKKLKLLEMGATEILTKPVD